MKHKKITFIPGTLGRFIRKYQISFEYLEVPPEMICRKRDHPGQKFFILTLRRPGGNILKIPYSQGAGVRQWPTVEQNLETLVSDILLYYNNPEFKDFVERMSDFGEIEDVERDYEVLKSLTTTTQKFLGEEGFQELIYLGRQGFELEGDGRWLKRWMCG